MPFPNIKNTNIKTFVYQLDKIKTAIVPEISVDYTVQSNSVCTGISYQCVDVIID